MKTYKLTPFPMGNLFNERTYTPDGANSSCRAILELVRGFGFPEHTWNKDKKGYSGNYSVARWENCREQGYVITIENEWHIVFFEHRNSDNLCVLSFNKHTINSPTIDDIPTDHPFAKSKHDGFTSFNYDKVYECAKNIYNEIEHLSRTLKECRKPY